MKRTLLFWILVALPLGCGGGGGSPPAGQPDPEPEPLRVSTAVSDALGVAVVQVDGTEQEIALESAHSEEPVEGIHVTVVEDGNDATVILLDPQVRYACRCFTVAMPDTPVSSKSLLTSASTQSVFGAAPYRLEDGSLDACEYPPRVVSTSEVRSDQLREALLNCDFDGALNCSLTPVTLDQLVDVLEQKADEIGVDFVVNLIIGSIGNVVAPGAAAVYGLIEELLTAKDLLEFSHILVWWQYFVGMCYGPDSQFELGTITYGNEFVNYTVFFVLPLEPPPEDVGCGEMYVGGTVRDAGTGLPIEGITVEQFPTGMSTRTDASGAYMLRIVGCPCDLDEIRILAHGLQPGGWYGFLPSDYYKSRTFSGGEVGLTRNATAVFDFCMGEGPCLGEWTRILDPLSENDLSFGRTVTAGQSTVAVTAHYGGTVKTGRLHVFSFEDNTWNGVYTYTAGRLNDNRFPPVMVDASDRLLLGDPAANDAYMFELTGGAWQLQAGLGSLLSPSATAEFGRSISADGDFAIVGAPSEVHDGQKRGAVYSFRASGGIWEFDQRLVTDPAPNQEQSQFGIQVAQHGDLLAIVNAVAVWDTPWSYSLHIYRREASGWVFDSKIGIPGYPTQMIVVGEQVLMGIPTAANDFSDPGKVVVLEEGPAGWYQRAVLQPADSAAGDRFGTSLSAHAGVLVVGAPGVPDGPAQDVGAAYVFNSSGGSWTEARRIAAPDSIARGAFGWSVSVSSDTVVVGAPGMQAGIVSSVYVARRN